MRNPDDIQPQAPRCEAAGRLRPGHYPISRQPQPCQQLPLYVAHVLLTSLCLSSLGPASHFEPQLRLSHQTIQRIVLVSVLVSLFPIVSRRGSCQQGPSRLREGFRPSEHQTAKLPVLSVTLSNRHQSVQACRHQASIRLGLICLPANWTLKSNLIRTLYSLSQALPSTYRYHGAGIISRASVIATLGVLNRASNVS
jgi:hypothetical protein